MLSLSLSVGRQWTMPGMMRRQTTSDGYQLLAIATRYFNQEYSLGTVYNFTTLLMILVTTSNVVCFFIASHCYGTLSFVAWAGFTGRGKLSMSCVDRCLSSFFRQRVDSFLLSDRISGNTA